jgi:methyl-accepting chemotaxis protein
VWPKNLEFANLQRALNRISITWQFTSLFVMALMLMLSGTALTLTQKYQMELGDKQAQMASLVEGGQSVAEYYVAQAKSGAMTPAQAQAAALGAISAVRYGGGNYLFVLNDDGVMLAHVDKTLIGANLMALKDARGKAIVRPLVAQAMAGGLAVNQYAFPKTPGAAPQPKITVGVGVPEWGWVIATGLYVDDIQDEMIRNTLGLVEIFTPLLMVFMGLVFVMRRSIARTLTGLSDAMGRLAAGDWSAEIPAEERTDELGVMARAVQVFKDNGLEKLRLEGEAVTARAKAEAERHSVEAERRAMTERQEAMVAALAHGLERLSDGHLLYRLNVPFAEEYEKLRGDFNAALEKLQNTMQAINVSTQGVRTEAGQIMQASDDLAQRTEQQAASLEQTATALDQVTATVRKTAANATEASLAIGQAKTDAEQSGKVVRATVEAMASIEASSRQIDSISGVIDEIAFQTNLLALNAGVEAARAGDAGRGFAVVATEVRALAQRSADAAREIKGLISASGKQVETGVRLVGETGKALGHIVDQVTRISALVVDIAGSAQQQASGLNEVNGTVTQMDMVTQKNAAMVQESTAASHSLAGEAEALARLVGQFRIDDPRTTARATPPPMPPVRIPGPIKTPVKSRIPVNAPTVERRDNGAPSMPVLARRAEDWNEF